MKETELKEQITVWLRLHRCVVVRHKNEGTWDGKRMVRRKLPALELGAADIIACSRTGRFIAIEAKIGNNKPSIEQDEWLRWVNENGGVGICVWSFDECEAALRGIV